jgi:hypothetical protein
VLGVIYTGFLGLLAGFIVQNPGSFAYTSPNRKPQNTLESSPLALDLFGDWYLRSAEANWMIGWHHHSQTTLTLSLGIGRTFVRSGLPPHELLRNRTMDSISTVRTNHASNNGELWNDDRLP